MFSRHRLASFRDWSRTVRALWREAQHREERYAAIALSGARPYRAYQTPAAVPLYEEMITGPMLLTHPDPIRPLLLAWSTSSDRWKRRYVDLNAQRLSGLSRREALKNIAR